MSLIVILGFWNGGLLKKKKNKKYLVLLGGNFDVISIWVCIFLCILIDFLYKIWEGGVGKVFVFFLGVGWCILLCVVIDWIGIILFW